MVVRAKMLGPVREKVTGMCRKFCDELHDLFASLNIITVKNETREGHIACMGKK
jgi:hypothetical protein